MINGKFLRKIEAKPSDDLATRTDLLQFQLEKPLDHLEWITLVQPHGNDEILRFSSIHSLFISYYRKNIRSYDPKVLFSVLLPSTCVNRLIYNLCLLNRVRYDMNYPLIAFNEDEWVDFWIYYTDPLFKTEFERMLKEHMWNG